MTPTVAGCHNTDPWITVLITNMEQLDDLTKTNSDHAVEAWIKKKKVIAVKQTATKKPNTKKLGYEG